MLDEIEQLKKIKTLKNHWVDLQTDIKKTIEKIGFSLCAILPNGEYEDGNGYRVYVYSDYVVVKYNNDNNYQTTRDIWKYGFNADKLAEMIISIDWKNIFSNAMHKMKEESEAIQEEVDNLEVILDKLEGFKKLFE